MPRISPRPTAAIVMAIVGMTIQLLGIIVSASFFSTAGAEPYSCLNHFISELGWVGRSPASWAYNWSLSVASPLYIPLIYSLARRIDTRTGYVAMTLGLMGLLAACEIGFLPVMVHLRAHITVASFLFSTWVLTAIIWSIALWRRPFNAAARLLAKTGVIVAAIAALFVLYPRGSLAHILHIIRLPQRPTIWMFPLIEWAVLFSFCAWAIIAVIALWQPDETSPRQQRG